MSRCAPVVVVVVVAVAVAAGLAACGIGENDPLPGIGQRCNVAEGHCDLEHVCVPSSPGAAGGICAPVLSFGACDQKQALSYPPGRKGKDVELDALEINGVEDLGTIQDVRSVTGQVRTFEPGVENVDIPDFCDFRALQQVGDGLALSDTSDVTTLDGLQSVTSVAQGLAILDNDLLEDISGLANVVDITPRESEGRSFDVVIAANPKLDDDEIDAFAAALKERVGRDLEIVACNNHGRPCGPDDVTLLNTLISQGFH